MIKKASLFVFLLLMIACGKNIEEDKKKPKTHSNDDNVVKTAKSISELKTDLLSALEEDDARIVETAIKSLNRPLDFTFEENDETPLTYAILNSRSEIIQLVLKNSTKLNLANKRQYTPLHLVVINNDFITFKSLLRKKIDLNPRNKQGETPLITALNSLNEAMASILLVHGADYSISDSFKVSPLEKAIQFSLPRITKLIHFIDGHQTPNISYVKESINDKKLSHLEYLLNVHPEYKEILKEHNIILEALKLGENGLTSKFVNRLLQHGADANHQEGITPLIAAVELGNFDIVKKLLVYNADITYFDQDEKTALSYAAHKLDFKTVAYLLRKLREKRKKENLDITIYIENACENLPSKNQIQRDEKLTFDTKKKVRKLLRCY